MIELERKLLTIFINDKTNLVAVTELIRSHKDELNIVGINGPFFNLLIGMRTFLKIGLVIEMLQFGFDLGHPNNTPFVHKALINSLNNQYSDELYDILQLLCSSANFLETITDDNLLDTLLNTDCDLDPVVATLLLHYDKGTKRIKRQMLLHKNVDFCERFRKTSPHIYDLIIN